MDSSGFLSVGGGLGLSVYGPGAHRFRSDTGRGFPTEANTEAGSMELEIVSILVEQLEGSFRLIGGEGSNFEVRFAVLRDGSVG